MIVYHFHSLAATTLSLQPTSNSDLWMQGSLGASMLTLKHPAMPCATFHTHNFIYVKN